MNSRTFSLTQGQVAQRMFAIWQKYISNDKDKASISPYRNKLLPFFLQRHFNLDFKEWERFAFYISKSDLLMGKRADFHIYLNWVLLEPNLLKVKRGLYHSLGEKKKYRGCRKIFLTQIEEVMHG